MSWLSEFNWNLLLITHLLKLNIFNLHLIIVFYSETGQKELYPWKFIFKAMGNLNYTLDKRYGFYSTHGVCISNLYPELHIDTSIGYTTFIMVVNFLSFILIGLSYIGIYR